MTAFVMINNLLIVFDGDFEKNIIFQFCFKLTQKIKNNYF